MGNKNNKKERINVVYSTNPNYQYEYNQEEEQETLAPEKQNLRVTLDSKQRKGKIVTLVQGFVGTEENLKELAKLLKNKCGVGGSVKDGEIIIQGEVKEKVLEVMREAGKPVSAGEVEKLSGLDRKEIDKAFKELKKEEAIVSPVRCKWEPANK